MATGRLPDPNTAPLTAKGDLYTYSTRGDRLAVGNNGDTLVADSSATTGLRWQGDFAAGKNLAINGCLDIWQRGTSFTPAAGTITQLADRWSGVRPTVTGWTVSQKSSATDTGVSGTTYFMRIQRNSGNSNTEDLNIAYNNLEGQSFVPLQGQSVTVSFWARAGSNYSSASSILNIAVVTGTTADTATWSVTGTSNSTTRTLTTSWQRFSYTFTFGATDKAMRTQFYYTPVGTASTNDYFDISNLQIEIGLVATGFQRTGGTLAGELAACQRYYYRVTAEVAYGILSLPGIAFSTTGANIPIKTPVTMRVIPTALDYPTVSTLRMTENIGSYTLNGTPIIQGDSTRNDVQVSVTTASGLTQYRSYFITANNSTTAYLGLSAEL